MKNITAIRSIIRSTRYLVLSCLLLFGIFGSNISFGTEKETPEISTTIDFLDYVFYYNYPERSSQTYLHLTEWEDCIADMAARGINKIYLRVNVGGLTLYPTSVGTQYGEQGGYHWTEATNAQRLIDTLDEYDPVAATISIGHSYGMEVWCWENLWDDAIVVYEPDANEYDTEVAAYGRFPLMDPFFRTHPDYYWQNNPQVVAEIDEANKLANGTGIKKIVFVSKSTGLECRVNSSNLSIYTSEDNVTFTEYTGPRTVSSVMVSGVNTLTIDNLNLTAKYVKLLNEEDWPSTNWSMILDQYEGKSKAYNADGDEVYTVWTWQNRVSPTTSPLLFTGGIPAAWDYLSRYVAFKTMPPHIGKIVFVSKSTGVPCRVNSSNLSIYTSEDNITFTEYTGTRTVSSAMVSGVNTLTIDDLNLVNAKYVKLLNEEDWATGSYSMILDELRGKSKVYDTNDNELYTVWTWGTHDNPTTAPIPFVWGVPAAWDYQSRYVGFTLGERMPYTNFLGVTELSIPAAKNYKLSKFEELADNYAFDGFMISLRTHSRVPGDANDYGYNQVIRDEYLSRYSVDIYTTEPDLEQLQDLKAESIDDFLLEVKALLDGRPLYMSGFKPRVSTDLERSYHEVYGDLPWHYDVWFDDESVDGIMMLGEYFPEYFTPEITGDKDLKLGFFRDLTKHTLAEFDPFLNKYCTNTPTIKKIVFVSKSTGLECRVNSSNLSIYASQDNVTFTEYTGPRTVSSVMVSGVNTLTIDDLDLTAKYVKLLNEQDWPATNWSMILDQYEGKSTAYDENGNIIDTVWTWQNRVSPTTSPILFTGGIPAAWDYLSRYVAFKTHPQRIGKIVFTSTSGQPCRVNTSNLSIYTSEDNITFTEYLGTRTVSSTHVDGVNVLTIDDLCLNAKYVKLLNKEVWPDDDYGYSMVLDQAQGKNYAYDTDGNIIRTVWTWQNQSTASPPVPITENPLTFTTGLPAAWDYEGTKRYAGFMVKALDEVELYETFIMSNYSGYYPILDDYTQ